MSFQHLFTLPRIKIGAILLLVLLCHFHPRQAVFAADLISFPPSDSSGILGIIDIHNEHWHFYLSSALTLQSDQNHVLEVNQAYADWQPENFGVSLGRKIIAFGPGRYGYPILGPLRTGEPAPLNTGFTAAGYDQVGYNFTWGKLTYQKFFANVTESGFRLLLGQRTTYDLGRFSFGFSEAALTNQQAPGYIYLPLPFIPVYFYQFLGYHVFKIPGTNASINSAVDFDVTWRPSANVKLYGEYYIDDRPWPRLDRQTNQWIIPEWDKWWWKVGYQAGWEWKNAFKSPILTLYGEYTRIGQYTYTSWHPGEWTPGLDWTYQGRYIGDWLGPDADRFNLELVWSQTPHRQWSFAYRRIRRGEGKIGDHWYYVPGQTEVFLTGVVETSDSLTVGITRKSGNNQLGYSIGLAYIYNAEHIPGNCRWQPQATLNMVFKLQ